MDIQIKYKIEKKINIQNDLGIDIMDSTKTYIAKTNEKSIVHIGFENVEETINIETAIHTNIFIEVSVDPKVSLYIDNYNSLDINEIKGIIKEEIDKNKEIYDKDLDVILANNKSFGKYVNGSKIPAKNKTVKEVIAMALQEYLQPSFNTFNINYVTTVETATVLQSMLSFSVLINNVQNVKNNSLTIKDITNNKVLIDNASILNIVTVNTDNIVKTETGQINQWQASILNTNGEKIHSAYTSIIWRNKTFYGSVDTLPATSAEIRNLSSIWDNQHTFNITINKLKYTIALRSGLKIKEAVTLNNENIKDNFIKRTSPINIVLGDGITTGLYDVYDLITDTILNLTAKITLE